MRRMLRVSVFVIVMALTSAISVGAAAAAPVRADVQDFSFTSLDVDYTLGRDEDGVSTLRVVETFVAEFPAFDQNRGLQRRIPETFRGAPLFPDVVSVTDADGTPRPIEEESENGALVVTSRADDFVHGAQTYVFTYDLRNVTRFFDDPGADELYLNVNGTDWAQAFGRVSARVAVDDSLAGVEIGGTACYRGAQGDREPCDIAREGDVVVADAADLAPHQTMTIAIGFPPGTFTAFDTSYLASPFGWLQMVAALVALGSVAAAVVARSRHLRDAPGRPTVIAEYEPPRGIDALESAVFLGRTGKAIPAEVLEQAVVGSIRIVEGRQRAWGGVTLQAELIDPSRADGDGRMLLEGLFGPSPRPGAVYEFGRTDTRFSSQAQKILSAASKELAGRGLWRTIAPGTRGWPIVGAAGAAVAAFVMGIIGMDLGVDPVVPVLVMFGTIVAFVLVIVALSRRPLTAAGAELRDHLAGLKEFIAWAEADRIRMLQSPAGAERTPVDVDDPRQMLRLYETLLPYAVVFGQEKKWAEELVVRYGGDGSPGWYFGTTGFNAAAFSAGIATLSTTAVSSSTGGSAGGGMAGGGAGGGGGGGV